MNYQEAKEIYQSNSSSIFSTQLVEFYKNKNYRGKALVMAVAKDIEKVRKHALKDFSENVLCKYFLAQLFLWEESEEGHDYWEERDLEL